MPKAGFRMKIAIMFVILGTWALTTGTSFSEVLEDSLRAKINLTLSKEKLSRVLELITDQSSLVFNIEDSVMQLPVDLKTHGEAAQTVLDQLGKKYNLDLDLQKDGIIYVTKHGEISPTSPPNPLPPTLKPTPGGQLHKMLEQLRLTQGPASTALDIVAAQMGLNLELDPKLDSLVVETTTCAHITPTEFLNQVTKQYGWKWEFNPADNKVHIIVPEQPPTPTPAPVTPVLERIISIKAADWAYPQFFHELELAGQCQITGPTDQPGAISMWHKDVKLQEPLQEVCKQLGLVFAVSGEVIDLKQP